MNESECPASCPQRGPGAGDAGTFSWVAGESFGGRSPLQPLRPPAKMLYEKPKGVTLCSHVPGRFSHTHTQSHTHTHTHTPALILVHGWDRIRNLNFYSLLALSTHKNVKCHPTMTKDRCLTCLRSHDELCGCTNAHVGHSGEDGRDHAAAAVWVQKQPADPATLRGGTSELRWVRGSHAGCQVTTSHTRTRRMRSSAW